MTERPVWCGRVGFEDFECGVGYWMRTGYEMKDSDCEICAKLYLAQSIMHLAEAIKVSNEKKVKK